MAGSGPAQDMLPLAGARVLELAQGISGPFAGKWLAALGADVIKLEPREGDLTRRRGPWPHDEPDPEKSGLFLYLNGEKRGAMLDLERGHDRQHFLELVARTDILIHSLRAGQLQALELGYDALAAVRPELVMISVTPFGLTGPYRDLPATSLTVGALSGTMWFVGKPGRPPLSQGGSQPEYLAGLHCLGAALTGYYGALVEGRGAHYDISQQECGGAAVGHFTSRASQVDVAARRGEPRALWRLYPCADGYAGICGLPRNYARLAEVMQIPEIRDLPMLLGVASEREERIKSILTDWFARRKQQEIYELGLAERAPLGYVMPVRDLVASPQLKLRGFFNEEDHPRAGRLVYPGRLWSSAAHTWREGRAPELGEHTQQVLDELARGDVRVSQAVPASPRGPWDPSDRPLRGIRVLDLGQIWAGPYAAMLLADQGAEVIKVESPTAFDTNRTVSPPPPGHGESWWNTCCYFHEYNHNKRCIGLDYRHERGREIIARLVASSDVVIENFRADVMDKLGLSYAWLKKQRPDVILLSMAAFGKTGPEKDMPGYGPIIEQVSGLAALTGYSDDDPPLLTSYAYGDPVAATAGAAAVMTALIHRHRTGEGQHIDLAQRDVAAALIGEAFMERAMNDRQPSRSGNARLGMAPHNAYPCTGDEDWIAIAVETDQEREDRRAAMGDPDWARAQEYRSQSRRCENRESLDAQVGSWTRGLSKTEVFERCVAHSVPAGPVLKPREVLADPQLTSRGFHESVAHPDAPPWSMHGWVWRLVGEGPCVLRLAPDFGGHNREVLVDLLGFSDAEVDQLEAQGVIAANPIGVPKHEP